VVPPLFRPTTSVGPALYRSYRRGPDRLLPVCSGDGIGAQFRTGSHQAFDFAQPALILW